MPRPKEQQQQQQQPCPAALTPDTAARPRPLSRPPAFELTVTAAGAEADLPSPPQLRALVMRYLDDAEFLSIRRELAVLRAQLSVLETDLEGLRSGVLVPQIVALVEQIRKSLRTYHDLEAARGQLVSVQRFLAVLPLLLAAIEKVVKDETAVRAIGQEWAKTLEAILPRESEDFS